VVSPEIAMGLPLNVADVALLPVHSRSMGKPTSRINAFDLLVVNSPCPELTDRTQDGLEEAASPVIGSKNPTNSRQMKNLFINI
jgi:hypothetical protein